MPALLARMSMGAFLGDGRGPSQFGVDGTVRFCERMDGFLRGILGDDLGGVGFSMGVFENERRFARFNKLAVGRSRKDQTASRDRNQIGGEGTGFRHKERVLFEQDRCLRNRFFRKNRNFLRGKTETFFEVQARRQRRTLSCAGAFRRLVSAPLQPACYPPNDADCSWPESRRSPPDERQSTLEKTAPTTSNRIQTPNRAAVSHVRAKTNRPRRTAG